VKRPLIVAAAIGLAGVVALVSFSYLPGKTGEQAIPQSEAVGLPVDLPLLFTETGRNYNTVDGSYAVVYENIVDSRLGCEFCTVVELRDGPSSDIPEVSWAADRSFNIRGAQKVTFYAMGDRGGEEVRFMAAGKEVETTLNGRLARVLDFDVRTKPVTLTNEWEKFEVDLAGADLTSVTGAFGIEPMEGQTVRIFLKGIAIEADLAEEPLEREDAGP
jgi:hypothetical protein